MLKMRFKKTLLIVFGMLLLFASCNRASFVKKLTGTWSISRYLYQGTDETLHIKDTVMNQYKLTFSENQNYMITWRSFSFKADTLILNDTLSYDTMNMVYNIKYDTIPRIDTTITPYQDLGRWDLLNSESDLQLTSSTSGINPVQYHILNLSGSSLNLRTGGYEYYLVK